LKKGLEKERDSIFTQRLSQSADNQPVKMRLDQINFRLQLLENPDPEPEKKPDPNEGLPSLKDRKIKIEGED